MEWWLSALVLFGALIAVLASGMPVAFGFLLINIVGAYFLWGGSGGLNQLIFSIFDSITKFNLLPIALFTLMGEILVQAEVVSDIFDGLDKWLGRLPGRLSLLSVAGGVVFGTLSGSSMAATAVMGSLMVPEMKKRGYKKTMYLGPVMSAGGLAMIIPPSGMAVLIGSLAPMSIGKLLVGGFIPGIMLAVFYVAYIILRCYFQPSLAPLYDVSKFSLSEKIISTLKFVLPMVLIIFLVIGLIILGVATPSEAAAVGAIGAFVLAAAYRKLTWKGTVKSFVSAIQVTTMMLIILTASTAFSQILSFSGAGRGMVNATMSLNLTPVTAQIIMQIIVIILGCFIDGTSILMITLPIFMPIVAALGVNPIWFGLLLLLNIESATKTPPFGFLLFIMKAMVPDATMGELYKSVTPFVMIELTVMAIIIAFPAVALWMPNMIK